MCNVQVQRIDKCVGDDGTSGACDSITPWWQRFYLGLSGHGGGRIQLLRLGLGGVATAKSRTNRGYGVESAIISCYLMMSAIDWRLEIAASEVRKSGQETFMMPATR
jgi:hypothetical protein